jgi:hypothetical protein
MVGTDAEGRLGVQASVQKHQAGLERCTTRRDHRSLLYCVAFGQANTEQRVFFPNPLSHQSLRQDPACLLSILYELYQAPHGRALGTTCNRAIITGLWGLDLGTHQDAPGCIWARTPSRESSRARSGPKE